MGVPFAGFDGIICLCRQDLRALLLEDVNDVGELSELLRGMDRARRTLWTLRIGLDDEDSQHQGPGLPLALAPFTALTYVAMVLGPRLDGNDMQRPALQCLGC
jgi:hypothetical protein